MVIIDTSAWIEYFQDGEPRIVRAVDYCLQEEEAGIGDLVYCEVMQGIKQPKRREELGNLLGSLPRFEMVGFDIAAQAAANYARLRSQGITVRKTMDVIIGTFCTHNQFPIIHHDRDFDLMAPLIGLTIWRC